MIIVMRTLFFILKILICFHQDDYYEHYPNVVRNWAGAVTFCEQKGGALATFKNQDMLDQFIAQFGHVNTWLGATDAAVEGTWVLKDLSNFTPFFIFFQFFLIPQKRDDIKISTPAADRAGSGFQFSEKRLRPGCACS